MGGSGEGEAEAQRYEVDGRTLGGSNPMVDPEIVVAVGCCGCFCIFLWVCTVVFWFVFFFNGVFTFFWLNGVKACHFNI